MLQRAAMHLDVIARELPSARLEGRTLRFGRVSSAVPVPLNVGALLPGGDPRIIDQALAPIEPGASCALQLVDVPSDVDLHWVALAIATRCQRWIDRRNWYSNTPLFSRVLELHRSLHDLQKPLVRADWEHALDTWQWVLRLRPLATIAVQVAALMHDIERLSSEPDQRVEHLTTDYDAFKDAHARAGAEQIRTELSRTGISASVIDEVARLVSLHERAGQGDLALLNTADALSFFSLNSPGFADYFSPEHTRRKVAWTLKRLPPAERLRLQWLHLRADVRSLVDELTPRAAEYLRPSPGDTP